MRGMINGAQGALLRAIRRFLENERHGFPAMVVTAAASEDWASATFTGQRHRLELSFRGGSQQRVDDLLRTLGEAELVVPGHIVACVDLVEHEMTDDDPPAHRLVLEALTIVD